MLRYDPSTKIWESGSTPTPIARHLGGAAATADGKIYVVGGIAIGAGMVTTVEEYDPQADSWVRASTPSGPTCTASPDTTPPGITAAITGTWGSNGWFTSNVTVSWSVTDDESSVSSTSGCVPSSVTSDTDGAAFTCEATSLGGSAEETVTVKRDTTPPTLVCPLPGPYALAPPLMLSATATDSLSGPSSMVISQTADRATPGLRWLIYSATDNAGNTTTTACEYVVTVWATKQPVLDAINMEIPGALKGDAKKLQEAAKQLDDSLDPSLWNGGSPDPEKGDKVFQNEKEAVQRLAEILKDKKSGIADAALQDWIEVLVGAGRALAQTAITDAGAGDAKKLEEAAREMAKAEEAAGGGKPAQAIEHYKNAWKRAQEAIRKA